MADAGPLCAPRKVRYPAGLGRTRRHGWRAAWVQLERLDFILVFICGLNYILHALQGWSDPFRLIPLIVISAGFNFCVGRALTRRPARFLLAAGIGGNLILLGYFKYAAFLLGTFAPLLGIQPLPVTVETPIGISFYTLTQIAFLVDAYRKQAREYKLLNYGCLSAISRT